MALIEVNKNTVEFVDGETVTGLLKRMNYTFPLVIVKIDGTVIPRKDFPDTTVQDGSRIEVIHLISGG